MLPDVTHRAEDLAFMAAAGETVERAALRVGTTVCALEKWARNNGHGEIWKRLVLNGPRDWNASTNKEWSAAS